MTKMFAAAATALVALAAPASAVDRDAPNHSETTMESPTNVALPGESGAQHQHLYDALDRTVLSATIVDLRPTAIAAGQTSRSRGSAEAAPERSERDKAAIAASREGVFARIRHRPAG